MDSPLRELGLPLGNRVTEAWSIIEHACLEVGVLGAVRDADL